MRSKRQNSRVTSRWVCTRFSPMLFQCIDCVFLALTLHPLGYRRLLQSNRNSRLLFGHLCRLKHIFKPHFKGPVHGWSNGLRKLAQASAITHILAGSASEASPSTAALSALVSESMIALLVCGPLLPHLNHFLFLLLVQTHQKSDSQHVFKGDKNKKAKRRLIVTDRSAAGGEKMARGLLILLSALPDFWSSKSFLRLLKWSAAGSSLLLYMTQTFSCSRAQKSFYLCSRSKSSWGNVL